MRMLTLFVLVFLLVGVYLIVTNYDIDLGTSSGTKTFFKEFARWLFGVGESGVDVVGYAAQQDWLPDSPLENETRTYVVYDTKEVEKKKSSCEYEIRPFDNF